MCNSSLARDNFWFRPFLRLWLFLTKIWFFQYFRLSRHRNLSFSFQMIFLVAYGVLSMKYSYSMPEKLFWGTFDAYSSSGLIYFLQKSLQKVEIWSKFPSYQHGHFLRYSSLILLLTQTYHVFLFSYWYFVDI